MSAVTFSAVSESAVISDSGLFTGGYLDSAVTNQRFAYLSAVCVSGGLLFGGYYSQRLLLSGYCVRRFVLSAVSFQRLSFSGLCVLRCTNRRFVCFSGLWSAV